MKDYDFEESNSQWKVFLLGYLGILAACAAVAGGLSLLVKLFQ